MAEGFARSLALPQVNSFSAGSRPSGMINPKAIVAMAELGIDISGQVSQGLDALPNLEFDWVITMGCGDNCPHLKAKNRVDWALPDPKSLPPNEFNLVRDEIQSRVSALLANLKVLG